MAKRGTDCQESIERSTVGARVTYCTAPGNTVPYPPLFDTIRQNHGFIDTDGHPENVDQIPEVAWSAALRSLLLDLASPSSDFISLGCDLGEGKKPKRRMSTRWVAGGYVQIMVRAREEQGVPSLQPLAKMIEERLRVESGSNTWEADLALVPVVLANENDVMLQSLWAWFHARASTCDRARNSRERLLVAFRDAVRRSQSDASTIAKI